jgi:hypothetical protein
VTAEVWKVHPVWDRFLVSSEGRVYNLNVKRMVGRSVSAGPRPGRVAPQAPYRSVPFRVDGARRDVMVHALVLETFVGPRPEGHDGDHINKDRQDNRLVNLRWRPTAENRADAGDRLRATTCKHGHPWSPENTRVRKSGARACRACERQRQRTR